MGIIIQKRCVGDTQLKINFIYVNKSEPPLCFIHPWFILNFPKQLYHGWVSSSEESHLVSTKGKFSNGVFGRLVVNLSLKCRLLFKIFFRVFSWSLRWDSFKLVSFLQAVFFLGRVVSLSLIFSRATLTLYMLMALRRSESRVSGREGQTACSKRLLGRSGQRSSLNRRWQSVL